MFILTHDDFLKQFRLLTPQRLPTFVARNPAGALGRFLLPSLRNAGPPAVTANVPASDAGDADPPGQDAGVAAAAAASREAVQDTLARLTPAFPLLSNGGAVVGRRCVLLRAEQRRLLEDSWCVWTGGGV
jgi:hypothetical protein